MDANVVATVLGCSLIDAAADLPLIFDILAAEKGGRAIFCDETFSKTEGGNRM